MASPIQQSGYALVSDKKVQQVEKPKIIFTTRSLRSLESTEVTEKKHRNFRKFSVSSVSSVVQAFDLNSDRNFLSAPQTGNLKIGNSKPAGRAPPGALLFVSRQKVSKKRLPLQGALLSRGPE
jgi:hypothetical protein